MAQQFIRDPVRDLCLTLFNVTNCKSTAQQFIILDEYNIYIHACWVIGSQVGKQQHKYIFKNLATVSFFEFSIFWLCTQFLETLHTKLIGMSTHRCLLAL